ncbi:hypothetical protein [Kingella potus]|uniref:hypothetical protein n=1 Tax=Kingella potus TaxID=265175 RepID=UPI0011C07FEB|nr:hypothetical protein [Kingella potus]
MPNISRKGRLKSRAPRCQSRVCRPKATHAADAKPKPAPCAAPLINSIHPPDGNRPSENRQRLPEKQNTPPAIQTSRP